MGVGTGPYHSPAERLARQYTLDHLPLGEDTADRQEANRLARQYEDRLRKKEITPSDLANARTEGKITASDQQKILARAARTPLQNSFRNLTPDQALQVWNKATPEEKQQVRPMLANKLSRLSELPPEKREALKAKILSALHP